MTDDSITNLSDATKSSMRNYAMVAGFMALLIYAAVDIATHFSNTTIPMDQYLQFRSVVAIVMLVCGVTLALLHKRDLVAITFLLFFALLIFYVLEATLFPRFVYASFVPMEAMMLILGIAMLLTRNEQRWICFLAIVPYSLLGIAADCISNSQIAADIWLLASAILLIVSLYASLCIGLENPKFPGYSILTADEEDASKDGRPVHFKVSGSVLGYGLIMAECIGSLLLALDVLKFNLDAMKAYDCCCGIMLILVGLIMLIAGRMKFTPFMFVMLGLGLFVAPSLSGLHYVVALYLILLGVICIFKAERRILVGIAVILFGLGFFFTSKGLSPSYPVLTVLTVAVLAIMAYVCFALLSDDRLKLV